MSPVHSNPIIATVFQNVGCATIEKTCAAWGEVSAMLNVPVSEPVKKNGKLLVLATFGDKKSKAGSLKCDSNLLTINGVIGDYDGGIMPLTTAKDLLERAGIRACLYTSWNDGVFDPPKYNGGPRWRVACPTSKPMTPDFHRQLMERINGVLGGVLAGESFTPAQGYFFGKRPAASFVCMDTFDDPTAGKCIDELDGLDAIAMGKVGSTPSQECTQRKRIGDDIFVDAVAREGRLLMTGDGRRELLKSYIASKSAKGLQRGDIKHIARGCAHEYFDPDSPVDWADIDSLIDSTCDKDEVAELDDLVALSKAVKEPRYKLLRSEDIAKLPPLKWRVRGVLPAVGLVAGYGPSGSGKSFLFLDMAAAIAEGRYWFGYRVEGAPVVYLVLEGEGGLQQRVAAWEKYNCRKLPVDLQCVVQPFTLTAPQDLADILAVIPKGAVVFIDTLNRTAPTADENSSRDMGQILQAAKTMQAKTEGLVVLVHHTGKDVSKGPRGHSSLFAAMDACVEVERRVSERKWFVTKSKDGRDGVGHAFDLVSLTLSVNDHGEVDTSCAVSPSASVPFESRKPLTTSQELAMSAFHELDLLGEGVQREAWRKEVYCRMADKSSGAQRTAFNRAARELVELGVLALDSARDWFSGNDLFAP